MMERTLLAEFFSLLLVAWWFEVARWAVLPGDGCLFGLFDKATQIHFRCTKQFRFAALHDSGQQDIQGTIHPRSDENSFCDRVRTCWGGTLLQLRIVKQSTKRGWMAEQPGRRNLHHGGKRFELRGRGINLFRFNFL